MSLTSTATALSQALALSYSSTGSHLHNLLLGDTGTLPARHAAADATALLHPTLAETGMQTFSGLYGRTAVTGTTGTCSEDHDKVIASLSLYLQLGYADGVTECKDRLTDAVRGWRADLETCAPDSASAAHAVAYCRSVFVLAAENKQTDLALWAADALLGSVGRWRTAAGVGALASRDGLCGTSTASVVAVLNRGLTTNGGNNTARNQWEESKEVRPSRAMAPRQVGGVFERALYIQTANELRVTLTPLQRVHCPFPLAVLYISSLGRYSGGGGGVCVCVRVCPG